MVRYHEPPEQLQWTLFFQKIFPLSLLWWCCLHGCSFGLRSGYYEGPGLLYDSHHFHFHTHQTISDLYVMFLSPFIRLIFIVTCLYLMKHVYSPNFPQTKYHLTSGGLWYLGLWTSLCVALCFAVWTCVSCMLYG